MSTPDICVNPKGERATSSKSAIVGCLLMMLVGAAPWACVFWQMGKGLHDMKRARDEFKRTVNPDDLRAWVFTQIKRNPEGGNFREAAADWPDTFPRFAGSRHFTVHLSPSHDAQGAGLIWGFSGGYGLKATVWLNPDGTPVDVEDDPPWAKGVTFDFLAK